MDANKPSRVKLRDVAAEAGISEAQASAALSGYRGVSAQTRERVREIASRLGYAPSDRARQLGGRVAGRRCAIVIGTDSATHYRVNPFLHSMLEGVLLRASELEIDVRLIPASPAAISDGSAFSALVASDRADAVLIHTYADLQHSQIAPLVDGGLPFVLLNRHFADQPQVDAVVADVGFAAADAAQRLAAQGKRRLVLAVGQNETSTTRDYCAGWTMATNDLGIADTCAIWRIDHHDRAAIAAALDTLLPSDDTRDGSRPEGIVAVDEVCAHDVLRRAEALGIAVPQELSILTCQSSIAGFTTPPLSSYDLQLPLIGARAIDVVATRLGLLQQPVAVQTVRVLPTYVSRGTTKD